MFTKLAFVLSAFVLAVSADQCNTGSLQCCNSVQDAHSPTVTTLLELVGVAVDSVSGQVGVSCSPISVIGLGANGCSTQPVCCEKNNFNGVVALGCSPVNVN